MYLYRLVMYALYVYIYIYIYMYIYVYIEYLQAQMPGSSWTPSRDPDLPLSHLFVPEGGILSSVPAVQRNWHASFI